MVSAPIHRGMGASKRRLSMPGHTRINFAMPLFQLLIVTLLIFASCQVDANTSWVQDDQMNFKIQVPSDYQKNRLVEGTDVVHAFLSPDQNVAIRIRSFNVDNKADLKTIIKAFEQNVIVGAQKLLDDKYVLNSIQGKICGYKWKFNNIPVGLACFFAIENTVAYIVWSIVPEQMFKQRTPETDAIINTFTILPKKSRGTTVTSGKKQKTEDKKPLTKTNSEQTKARFFDLVSDDAKITHRVPVGFKLSEKTDGQAIWQNESGVKMVVQTITKQGEFKSYINDLVSEIKGNGASVLSNEFTVENGLTVANYSYQYGDSHFAYGATTGESVYYLVGFVGKTKDKDELNSFSEETNMSLKKAN